MKASYTVRIYCMCMCVQYYQGVFEEPFLSDMGELYKQLAAQLVAELSYSDYLGKVQTVPFTPSFVYMYVYKLNKRLR